MSRSIPRDFIARLTATTTAQEIAERLQISRRGARCYCPACQPDPSAHRTPDLSFIGSGFRCFKCERSGGDAIAFIQTFEGLAFPEAVRRVADLVGLPLETENTGHTAPSRRVQGTGHGRRRTTPFGGDVRPPNDPAPRPELFSILEELVAALPGSPGEEYLTTRGFSVELAARVGIGYASADDCRRIGFPGFHPRLGRVVFSHYCPTGRRNAAGQAITQICSLYGRAIELGEYNAGDTRHRHLKAPKGMFNLGAVDAIGYSDPLFICEGAFDALAWIAAGHPRTIATYGAHLDRFHWLGSTSRVCVAFDNDAPGRSRAEEVAAALSHLGKQVELLEAEDIAGYKDAAAAWAAGQLRLPIGIEPRC